MRWTNAILILCGIALGSVAYAVAQQAPTPSYDDVYWDDRFFAPVPPKIANMVIGQDGTLYVVGSFNQIGGVLADGLAAWDGEAWYALPRASSSYAGRVFTVDGRDHLYADIADGFAHWDGSDWTLRGGLGGHPNTIAVAQDGIVYAGGGGTRCRATFPYNCSRYGFGVKKWTGSEWATLDGDLLIVDRLAVGPSDELYAVAATEVEGSRLEVWRWDDDGSSWFRLGDLTSGLLNISGLTAGSSGTLFVAGRTVNQGILGWAVEFWDGDSWTRIRRGMYPHSITLDNDGRLLLASLDGDVVRLERWNGETWEVVDDQLRRVDDLSTYFALKFGIDRSGSLYAAGSFSGPNGVANLARLVGDTWEDDFVPRGMGLDGGGRFVPYGQGHLLVRGGFRLAGSMEAQGLAVWDGHGWRPAVVEPEPEGSIYARAVGPDGTMYVGGSSIEIDGSMCYIARHDGEKWVAVVSEMTRLRWGGAHVRKLAVGPNGDLYAHGNFASVAGVEADNIARWDGTQWHALAAGLNSVEREPHVRKMLFDEAGDLYVGGDFREAGGLTVNSIARWDGAAWHSLGSGVRYPYLTQGVGWVSDMVFLDGTLYVGGYFNDAGGVVANHIAAWDGQRWSSLQDGCNEVVHALEPGPEGDLYVGGRFVWASGVSANGIARWTGERWEALGTGVTGSVGDMAFDSLGALMVAGGITRSGEWPAYNVARWLKTTGVTLNPPSDAMRVSLELRPVFPNPTAESAYVTLSVPETQNVRLVVYDLVGRQVATVHDGLLGKHDYQFSVDTRSWPAGLYIVSATGEKGSARRPLVHVR